MTSTGMVVVGMKYIASVSFGKDSLAMLLRLMEESWPLDVVVFYDTGMEFDCIYKIRDKIKPVLKERGVEYMNKRISYFKDYAEQKPSLNPPFSSVYVCKDILPKQIVFEEVDK